MTQNSNLTHPAGNPERYNSSSMGSGKNTGRNISTLWLKMTELYGDKWTGKNGTEPSSMWKRATAGLSDNQFEMIFTFCLDRCMNGNPWPPELSDVIVMLSDKLVDSNAFGIPFDDMLRDFNKYLANRRNYRSAEMYPFRHPVQYWIFTELRDKVYDLRLTEPEVEKRLAKMIRQWADRVAKGEPIPRPVLRMEDKTRPPPAWMEMLERKKQRSA